MEYKKVKKSFVKWKQKKKIDFKVKNYKQEYKFVSWPYDYVYEAKTRTFRAIKRIQSKSTKEKK